MVHNILFSIKEPKRLLQHKEFFFDEYNYYFNEREKIKREISFSLHDKVVSYSFTDWFRLTSTKYAMNPLSCIGSMWPLGRAPRLYPWVNEPETSGTCKPC